MSSQSLCIEPQGLNREFPPTFLWSKRYRVPACTTRPFTGHLQTSEALTERQVLEDIKALACYHRSARFGHQDSAKRPL